MKRYSLLYHLFNTKILPVKDDDFGIWTNIATKISQLKNVFFQYIGHAILFLTWPFSRCNCKSSPSDLIIYFRAIFLLFFPPHTYNNCRREFSQYEPCNLHKYIERFPIFLELDFPKISWSFKTLNPFTLFCLPSSLFDLRSI